MADTKISALSAGTAFAGTEEIPGVQSANTVKFTAAQIRNYVLATPVAVVGNATAGAEIRLPEDTDNGTNYVAIKAPDNLAGTYTLTLPPDDGNSNEVLSTNGSGTLSWVAAPGASAPLTLAGGTVTDPSPPLTITQTWNDAADTFRALTVNITDTASNAASMLMDLQIGGSSRFSVTKAGGVTSVRETITTGTITASTPAISATQTWNSGATTFTGASMNITDTSSAAASLLMDLQVGGTTQMSVRKDGRLTINGPTNSGAFIVGTAGFRGGSIGIGFGDGNGGFAPGDSTAANFFGRWDANGIVSAANKYIGFNGSTATAGPQSLFYQIGTTAVIAVRGANTSTGGALNFLEQTAPSAPSTNQVVIYAEDNGSGKTRLMALFATGAAQQIAIEP